ncbi:hypothetical protein P7C70_g4328, partial [Phenoliferia sp. Uapishka_3]
MGARGKAAQGSSKSTEHSHFTSSASTSGPGVRRAWSTVGRAVDADAEEEGSNNDGEAQHAPRVIRPVPQKNTPAHVRASVSNRRSSRVLNLRSDVPMLALPRHSGLISALKHFSAASPLRQNAGEITRLRREIQALSSQLNLTLEGLEQVEMEAEQFVRAENLTGGSDGGYSSASTTRSTSVTAPSASSTSSRKPVGPPPKKRASITKPPVARVQSPPSPPAPQQSMPQQDATYYKRGFSTAGWGSWDRKDGDRAGPEQEQQVRRTSGGSTWAAAPPGPRRYDSMASGWAGAHRSQAKESWEQGRGNLSDIPLPHGHAHPAQPGSAFETAVRPPGQQPPQAHHNSILPYPKSDYHNSPPPADDRPSRSHPQDTATLAAPPLTSSYSTSAPAPRHIAHPPRPSSAPESRSLESLLSVAEERSRIEKVALPPAPVVDLPPMRRSSEGSYENGKKVVALPSIKKWFGKEEENHTLEEGEMDSEMRGIRS